MLEKFWAKPFAEKIFPLINEENFSVLYSYKASRPNTPVNVIVGGMVFEELMGLTDEEFMDSLLFDIRFQYALHTTSLKEQPVSDRTFSRFRRGCLTYETETGIDLIHDTVKELSGKMATLMKLNDRMKRMDSLMVASNIRKLGGWSSFIPVLLTLYLFSTVPGWTTFWEVWNIMIITRLFIIAKVRMHQTDPC